MSLKEELDAFTAVVKERLGPHAPDLFAGQIDRARDHGVPEASLKPGDTAPDFTLPDATGRPVTLAALLAEGPVVLCFYRGGWCPYCSIQLRALQQILPDLQAAGTTMVAVSPETPDNALTAKEREGLAFHVLSDAGNVVAKQFGLAFPVSDRVHEILVMVEVDLARQNGQDSGEIPVPATYVIAPDRTIAFGGAEPDYRTRIEPEAVLAAVRRLQPR
ncbi:peroxiredoxin-like family protein [Marinibaculum pumilum]|uniref:thioredoxin-dependent peroxiredoxin n=1 Tax=Marinibaculum pumilum TaxID=1766165 RepID=A0ABV7L1L8_9PROT